MIIVPDDPGPAEPTEVFQAVVSKVFDGDGFLAKVWNPVRQCWVERVPFRFAFIDAPEMQQVSGTEARVFLSGLIQGKTLRLDPIGKESTGYMPIDPYKRVLCMAFLSEQLSIGRIDYYQNGGVSSGTLRRVRAATRNIELEMVVNGWAWVTEQYAFERETDYFGAQEDAQRHRRGLWAVANPEPPWTFKARQKRRKQAGEGQGTLI